jgi:Holliday junction resolvasome RuvABC ATP-dependent DNA helicase subunit
LIIRGARQVGKTTLVKICAKQLELNLVELNLEKPFRFTSALSSGNPKKVMDQLCLAKLTQKIFHSHGHNNGIPLKA